MNIDRHRNHFEGHRLRKQCQFRTRVIFRNMGCQKFVTYMILMLVILLILLFILTLLINSELESTKMQHVSLAMKFENHLKESELLFKEHKACCSKNDSVAKIRTKRFVHERNLNNQQNKRKKPHKSTNIIATHFKGRHPEITVINNGILGSWIPNNNMTQSCGFSKFHLNGQSIEITEAALYLIYAQVYYSTSNLVNSYTIYSQAEGSTVSSIIARCSSAYSSSCFTASVQFLKKYDRIYINQTEKNRTINLRDGYSFVGIVRLSATCC